MTLNKTFSCRHSVSCRGGCVGWRIKTKAHAPNICGETPARSNNLYLIRTSRRRAVHLAATSKISRAVLNRQAIHTHASIFANDAGTNNPLLLGPLSLSSDNAEARKAVPAQYSFELRTTRQTEGGVLLQGLDGDETIIFQPPPSYYCYLGYRNSAAATQEAQCRFHVFCTFCSVLGEYGLTECQFPTWVDRQGKAVSPASHMMVQPLMQRREATAWRL